MEPQKLPKSKDILSGKCKVEGITAADFILYYKGIKSKLAWW